jgi:hypothetical protein
MPKKIIPSIAGGVDIDRQKIGESEKNFGKNYFRKRAVFLGENERSRSRRLQKPLKSALLCFGKSRALPKTPRKRAFSRCGIQIAE